MAHAEDVLQQIASRRLEVSREASGLQRRKARAAAAAQRRRCEAAALLEEQRELELQQARERELQLKQEQDHRRADGGFSKWGGQITFFPKKCFSAI